MTTKIISVKQYAQYLFKLGDNLPKAAKRGILSGAMRALPIMQRRTTEAGAVNTRTLLRAWKAERTENGAIIYNSMPYSGVVEYGRRPGKFPPKEAIARWAQRRMGLSRKESLQAAFLISRSIAKRGIKARRIAEGATKEITDAIMTEVDREIAKELEQVK